MSIEEALLKSAAAQEKLAAAMDRYAGVMERIAESGVAFVGGPGSVLEGASTPAASTGKTDDKPATGKKPTAAEKKAAEKKAAEDAAAAAAEGGEGDDTFADGGEGDDPFADGGEAEKNYTFAEVRELILKVRDKGGEKKNAAGAVEILTKLGVKSMSEIKDANFNKAAKLCLAAL
jgi:hypothetical protein